MHTVPVVSFDIGVGPRIITDNSLKDISLILYAIKMLFLTSNN